MEKEKKLELVSYSKKIVDALILSIPRFGSYRWSESTVIISHPIVK
jgi:hypothetical protein